MVPNMEPLKKEGDTYLAPVECFNCKTQNPVEVAKKDLVKDHIRRVNCSCDNCGRRLT